MTSRRPRGSRPNNNTNNNHYSRPQPSDYESDNPNYLSDTQALQNRQQEEQNTPLPPPLRSNEDLNISVLRRHNPSITSILSLAPYAVVYIFSPTARQWEKSGIEGTMFVCQLSQGTLGEERYSVYVLNRRGLNNFEILLMDGEDVELTDEYVILKADASSAELDVGGNSNDVYNGDAKTKGTDKKYPHTNVNEIDDDVRFYGLWIYSEPPPNSTAETRTLNARVIKECAVHAGESLKLARERLEAAHQNDLHVAAATTGTAAVPTEEVQTATGAAMGRQISLQDLFGQQRAVDDGWSVRAHNLGCGELHQQMRIQAHTPATEPGLPPAPNQDILGDLFRRAGLAYQGGGQQLS